MCSFAVSFISSVQQALFQTVEPLASRPDADPGFGDMSWTSSFIHAHTPRISAVPLPRGRQPWGHGSK